MVENISLPCWSVPRIKLELPPSDHEGGVNASINETVAGSKGLYGETTPAKTEQRKIINKIVEEIIAIFELKKL
jgi:hypothetical protein|tara:strand:+ start:586 stop:807 length:222 start_codon:yes stop_codon:yes gene_type:complete